MVAADWEMAEETVVAAVVATVAAVAMVEMTGGKGVQEASSRALHCTIDSTGHDHPKQT